MNETEHDIRVVASWCNDGSADIYVDCPPHGPLFNEPFTTSLTWSQISALVQEHLGVT